MEAGASALALDRTLTPTRTHRIAIACALVFCLTGAPARAQSGGQTVDGWDAARWRFGPLAVTPRVELKNLGWDSNVFLNRDNPTASVISRLSARVAASTLTNQRLTQGDAPGASPLNRKLSFRGTLGA